MAFAEPVTLEGEHVRLEPMTHARADAIATELGHAAADGAMWESKVTTIPRQSRRPVALARSITPSVSSVLFRMPFFARKVRMHCAATMNGMNSGQR